MTRRPLTGATTLSRMTLNTTAFWRTRPSAESHSASICLSFYYLSIRFCYFYQWHSISTVALLKLILLSVIMVTVIPFERVSFFGLPFPFVFTQGVILIRLNLLCVILLISLPNVFFLKDVLLSSAIMLNVVAPHGCSFVPTLSILFLSPLIHAFDYYLLQRE